MPGARVGVNCNQRLSDGECVAQKRKFMPGGYERNHKQARVDIRGAPPQISAQWDSQRNNVVDNVVAHR